ncbi:ABC transporter [Streptomyces coacervatus]|uniref:ABC transporter n=1 Tax=Streptomyces coacervatus TaxID=647381 RepID=A0ABP7JFE6_9ACTN|nr:ABC transporter [Streptomyces coacervatus]MDF2271263.1 ABC transporter [Streptomyces coacervatus]
MSGDLVSAVARTVPWRALAAGGGAGLLIVALPRLLSDGPPDGWLALTLLRTAALVFALGLTFLLDDPARHLTTPVVTRRWVRSGLRVVLVAPVAALWWTAALVLVPHGARPPVGAVTLEAGAIAALALAAAATAVRLTDEPEPGPSVAAAVLTTVTLGALLIPARWTLTAAVGDPRWGAAHDRWAVVLGVAVVAWAVCLPEPVRRRSLLFRRRSGTLSPSSV